MSARTACSPLCARDGGCSACRRSFALCPVAAPFGNRACASVPSNITLLPLPSPSPCPRGMSPMMGMPPMMGFLPIVSPMAMPMIDEKHSHAMASNDQQPLTPVANPAAVQMANSTPMLRPLNILSTYAWPPPPNQCLSHMVMPTAQNSGERAAPANPAAYWPATAAMTLG